MTSNHRVLDLPSRRPGVSLGCDSNKRNSHAHVQWASPGLQHFAVDVDGAWAPRHVEAPPIKDFPLVAGQHLCAGDSKRADAARVCTFGKPPHQLQVRGR